MSTCTSNGFYFSNFNFSITWIEERVASSNMVISLLEWKKVLSSISRWTRKNNLAFHIHRQNVLFVGRIPLKIILWWIERSSRCDVLFKVHLPKSHNSVQYLLKISERAKEKMWNLITTFCQNGWGTAACNWVLLCFFHPASSVSIK